MITEKEQDYLTAIGGGASTMGMPIFTGLSCFTTLKKVSINAGRETFSYALYQFGLLVLAHYMEVVQKSYPAGGEIIVKKKEMYFDALQILNGLSMPYPGFIYLFGGPPETIESVQMCIDTYESVLLHEFFDGVFEDHLPSMVMKENKERQRKRAERSAKNPDMSLPELPKPPKWSDIYKEDKALYFYQNKPEGELH